MARLEPPSANADDGGAASITAQPGWYWDWDFPKHHPNLNEVPTARSAVGIIVCQSHHELRKLVRAFILEHIIPFLPQWEAEGEFPRELHRKAYQCGVYAALWPTSMGGTPPPLCKGNIDRPGEHGRKAGRRSLPKQPTLFAYSLDKYSVSIGPHEVDIWHDFILNDELANCGAGGVIASCFVSLAIGLPPLIAGGLAGGPGMTFRLVREIVKGEKILSLAVTEPYAGSDVANVQTKAVLQADGKHYLVNGVKTFITSGPWADYFTTAVGDGCESGTVLSRAIGVSTTRLATQGWKTSGTARVTFEDVKVPVEMLIGSRGHGFKAIMHNFNHERLMLAVHSNRYARICMEDAIRYAKSRRTFGKRLIDHQGSDWKWGEFRVNNDWTMSALFFVTSKPSEAYLVIRHKIAEMARGVLATHTFIEDIVIRWPESSQSELAGRVALLKVQATKTFEFCAREASQILGGRSYLQGSGPGARIERLYREVRVNAIGGGSEEVTNSLRKAIPGPCHAQSQHIPRWPAAIIVLLLQIMLDLAARQARL